MICKRNRKGYLYLYDGTIIEGCGFGSQGYNFGEVVFTTSMNGYPEALTDPSYKGQILIITHPLVGNYGVPKMKVMDNNIIDNFESEKIQVEGLIVSEETEPRKWNSYMSLHEWLSDQGIPGLSDVDTRFLVKKIRDQGVVPGIISSGVELSELKKYNYDSIDFTDLTSPKEIILHKGKIDKNIVVIDCGVKHGILKGIYESFYYNIIRVPCKSNANEIMKFNPGGIVFSNGPGNPNLLNKLIDTYNAISEYKIPILGICLGHQIGTLALGGKVKKMKYGHRAINKPVIDLTTEKSYITTHNHGYAILSIKDLPNNVKPWFIDPDDKIIEGWISEEKKILSVQFHPEARPGPLDTTWIFEKFKKMVE
ncbi:carbamoyl-phosphate synthase, small subunit [Caldisphaera lagunensis DSM 15908]|uniref:Carbamoyl phosphate synthase small chain n=1 Tax=Caldisphaera lagunensis (strain DSM 15908 / JCM 11604 / ANMR 0165 / IC-154) TaxID=1056495 RepID=L0ABH5_CALLD|nr:glutamine-hydrolyzing carbamoyl-phosphate synthase small subunit [Caldisphaera lagunensis]AFZ71211.1 carbamoyl-phosphate synthase, small subunit [Caldisphaera lagunensis DSM 15908]